MLPVIEGAIPPHTHHARENACAVHAQVSGGLAPWQKRRAFELMARHLRRNLRLGTIAQECRLSSSHFARSFKRSFGITVHQYLLAQRVAAAKLLLETSTASLTDIALEIGFSDQTAFNRTFKAVTGTTPGQWRRAAAQAFAKPASVSSTRVL